MSRRCVEMREPQSTSICHKFNRRMCKILHSGLLMVKKKKRYGRCSSFLTFLKIFYRVRLTVAWVFICFSLLHLIARIGLELDFCLHAAALAFTITFTGSQPWIFRYWGPVFTQSDVSILNNNKYII